MPATGDKLGRVQKLECSPASRQLLALTKTQAGLRPLPSYATVRRFLAAYGFLKRHPMTTIALVGWFMIQCWLSKNNKLEAPGSGAADEAILVAPDQVPWMDSPVIPNAKGAFF